MRLDGKSFLAELIGTFTLVFFGAGAIMTQNANQIVGMTGIAVAHGIAILVMIYAFGHISGGHFNPAVTFAAVVSRRMSPAMGLMYWVAQCLGAALGAWVLLMAWHGPTEAHLGTPTVAAGVSPTLAMCLEGVMAFMLVIVIAGSAFDLRASKGFQGLAIGLTLVGNILAGGALTGASFNPARAFGPALVSGYWQDQWLYWVGPLLGGAIAVLVYDNLLGERNPNRS
ncbi:MAG TPA: MIP family channel protein [Candidatus Eisenbacteria bacterium]|nr:MIP family channel protein [Candidatus Eisenbacteria bacterium]